MGQTVIEAAWLHDIGYAPEVKDTGMHAIDGAAYLRDRGWSAPIVSLVAHHTGAWSEAYERGLADELNSFDAPPSDLLDALILCDLVVSPNGERVAPDARIAEIFHRYPDDHPVYRAVNRSREGLTRRANRAWSVLSADVRRASSLEGML